MGYWSVHPASLPLHPFPQSTLNARCWTTGLAQATLAYAVSEWLWRKTRMQDGSGARKDTQDAPGLEHRPSGFNIFVDDLGAQVGPQLAHAQSECAAAAVWGGLGFGGQEDVHHFEHVGACSHARGPIGAQVKEIHAQARLKLPSMALDDNDDADEEDSQPIETMR